MICPKCQKFEFHAFCPDCGTPKAQFVEHNCECGEQLGRYQAFCSKCGHKAPEIYFATEPAYTIIDKLTDEALND